MATIIDSLIVLLKLDPKGFEKGRKDTDDGLKKTREGVEKTGKGFDEFSKRSAEGIGKLKNEAIGLFLAFQGASSVEGFLKTLITGDAATGRLAKNIGVATNTLSAWQLVAKSVGGDAKDADTALSSIANAFQSYQLTGSTGNDADFKGLGVTLADLKAGPDKVLLRMAEAGERMGKPEFAARLHRLGIPDSVINALEKGRKGVEALVKEKERDGAASQADADKAAALQAKLAELEAKITGAVRPAVYNLVQGLLDIANNTDAVNAVVPIMVGLLGAGAIAAVAAAGPFIAMAAAIAAVTYAMNRLITTHPKVESFLDNIESPIRNALGPKWAWLFTRPDGDTGNGPPPAAGGDPLAGLSGDARTAAIRKTFPGYQPPRGGGGGGSGAGAANSNYIENFLKQSGFTVEQAKGIRAGISAEGGGLGEAANGAFGLGQWRGPRKAALFARYGRNPSIADQLAFLVSELKGGDSGGASVRGGTSADDTGVRYLRDFMRPQGARGEHYQDLVADVNRMRRALGGSGARASLGGARTSTATTTVGTIVVHTAATDASGIAAALPGAIQRRGLTNQANTGLQ